MFNDILVICVGNICRSPVGERLLRQLLPDRHVHSAGLSALVGEPADAVMTKVAADNGLSLDGHIARQFDPEMARSADLILAMESGHISRILDNHMYLSGKLFLFDKFAGAKGIPDPYRRSPEYYQAVYERVDQAALAWSRRL